MFSLTYCMNGITYGDIMEMVPEERDWYIRRLDKQIKRENEEIKKGARGTSRGRKR